MQISRSFWLIVIGLFCVLGITAWETPRVVVSALADPYYSDSPQMTVQHFWQYLDSRQTNLARGLLVDQGSSISNKEIDVWQHRLESDAFLTLQKMVFLDTRNPNALIVQVFWSSPGEKQTITYSFDIRQTVNGWRIQELKRLSNLSSSGWNLYGEFS